MGGQVIGPTSEHQCNENNSTKPLSLRQQQPTIMAPRTRLQAAPERRVRYDDKPRALRRPKRKICKICQHRRPQSSFPAPREAGLCGHMMATCRRCVEGMLRAEVNSGRVNEDKMDCPFSRCRTAISYAALKGLVSKGVFEM
jgi:hypothetical protein